MSRDHKRPGISRDDKGNLAILAIVLTWAGFAFSALVDLNAGLNWLHDAGILSALRRFGLIE